VKAHGEMTNPTELGRMIQQGRLVRGLSQQALADQLGMTQKQVSDIENGTHRLLMDRIFALRKATGVRFYAEIEYPDDLLPRTEKE
jgi:HTH-type transcriptional regulator/antitoxin HipB